MRVIWQVSTIGVAAILLAGCATPSAKITTELVRFGLDQKQAACIGDRLQSRLSVTQLRQLANAARAYSINDPNLRQLTVADLMRASSQIKDPQIAVETIGTASKCGVISSLFSR